MDRDPPRLLLVDDDPDNLEVLAAMLGGSFRVFKCGSPTDALNAVEAVRPDVLVLDIGMRPIDGMQCLAAIRAAPGRAGIPAVAVTGFARDVDRKAFLAAGFQAVIAKPILDERRFFSAIEGALRSRRPPWGPAGDRSLAAS